MDLYSIKEHLLLPAKNARGMQAHTLLFSFTLSRSITDVFSVSNFARSYDDQQNTVILFRYNFFASSTDPARVTVDTYACRIPFSDTITCHASVR